MHPCLKYRGGLLLVFGGFGAVFALVPQASKNLPSVLILVDRSVPITAVIQDL